MYWNIMRLLKDVYKIPPNYLKTITGYRTLTTHLQDRICCLKHVSNTQNIFRHAKTPNKLASSEKCFSVSLTAMAKGREKGEKKKKVGKAQNIDLNQIQEVLDVNKYTSQMEYAIDELKNHFIKHLTLRSSIGSIDQVAVEFEGEEYLLQDLVQIVTKPKMVVLQITTFPQAIPQILDALSKSGMNLNPQQDGTTLFIPIPK